MDKNLKKYFGIVLIIFLLPIGWGLFRSILNMPKSPPKTEAQKQIESDKWTAMVMSEKNVKDYLKLPKTAKFDSADATKIVIKLDNGTYGIRNWVTSENAFGGKVRMRYFVNLKKEANGTWTLLAAPLFNEL